MLPLLNQTETKVDAHNLIVLDIVKTTIDPPLWQYGLWSFHSGETKLERFLHKNQHTQRKLLNFEFWIIGSCQK